MKASEWNNPENAPHSEDLWIAIKPRTEDIKVLWGYKSYNTGKWYEYAGHRDNLIECSLIIGWLPAVIRPTWEPDDE